jgi:hypothetical protein
MNVVLGVQRDGYWREVRLDDYSTPHGEELAQADALDWIKGLRHARVDGRRMRERFTFRGDSLWWFTELYLHKEQAILTIMRTIVRFDALIDAERPQRVRWVRGDRVLTSVIRELSRTRHVPYQGPEDGRWLWARRRLALQVWATALHAAAIRPRRRDRVAAAQSGSVIAFVHRAFSASRAATAPGGEWYIGSVLQQIASRVPAGALRLVGVGPLRNFRVRRWWLASRGDGTPTLEQFSPDPGREEWRQVWRQRQAHLHALLASDDLHRRAVIRDCDCWPIVREQLLGIAWLQWPWAARTMDQVAGVLDAWQPAACLTYAEAGGVGRAIALECRRRAVPLAGLQHGFVYRHWLNYRHDADEMAVDPDNPADRGFPRPAITLAFDEFTARHLEQVGHFPRETLTITGSPTRDDLVRAAGELTAAQIANARRATGARDDQHLLLVATKHKEARAVLPDLIAAVRGLPDVHLAIKAHPAETPEAYGPFPGAANVTVLPASVPLAPLLAAARAVVTVNSTVAVDALALGVPSLVIGLPNNLSPFVTDGAMLGAVDSRAIAETLDRLLHDDGLRRDLVRRGAEIIGGSGVRGHAAEDSALAILALTQRVPARSPLRDVS